MNSHDDNEPLHPYIEPELEARLTALVLGEASDFERDELERLVGERPELGLLRKRLTVTHQMLREVATGEAEDREGEWKLSSDRRKALLAVIDGEAASGEVESEKVVVVETAGAKKSRVTVLWQIAACLAIAAVLFALVMPASNGIMREARRTGMEEHWVFEMAPETGSAATADFSFSAEESAPARSLKTNVEGRDWAEVEPTRANIRIDPLPTAVGVVAYADGTEASTTSLKSEVYDYIGTPNPKESNLWKDFSISAGEVTRFGRTDRESTAEDRPSPHRPTSPEHEVAAAQPGYPATANPRPGLSDEMSRNLEREAKPSADLAVTSGGASNFFTAPGESAETLNRVVSGNPSPAAGTVTMLNEEVAVTNESIVSANGRVSGGTIVVGDGLEVISSPDIDGDGFMAGGDVQFDGGATGNVGAIDGTVALGTGGEIMISEGVSGEVTVAGVPVTGKMPRFNPPKGPEPGTEGPVAMELSEELKSKVSELATLKKDRIPAKGDATVEGAGLEMKAQGNVYYANAADNLGAVRASGESGSGGRVAWSQQDQPFKEGEPLVAGSGGTIEVSGTIRTSGSGSLDVLSESKKDESERGRDQYGIDLNSPAPEVVEFDGFMNYKDQGAPGDGPSSGQVPAAAGRQITRADERVAKAESATRRGRELMDEGDRAGAATEFKTALDLLPDAPVTWERREAAAEELAKAKTELAREYADEAEYDKARRSLEEALVSGGADPLPEAKRLLGQLNDPEYYSPALTPEHLKELEEVSQNLRKSEGLADLGDFGRAEEEYRQELKKDPSNSAARRGLESVDEERRNYYETARNQTRSEFLRGVAEGWELPVPAGIAESADQPDQGEPQTSPSDGEDATPLPALRQIRVLTDPVAAKGSETNQKAEPFFDDPQAPEELAFTGVAKRPVRLDYGIPLDSDEMAESDNRFDGKDHGQVAPIQDLQDAVAEGGDSDERVMALTQEVSPSLGKEPVTAGLRSGSQSLSGDSIDGLISVAGRGTTDGKEAVAMFGVAGVFVDPQFGYVAKSLKEELRRELPAGLDETAAAEESFSTFSLHVSDVSFQLAQASLAKGEWPEADRIRIEEFVNAFDYADPMPAQSDRVACRVEQAVHPFLQQRNLLRIAMRTAEAGRSAGTPLRLTLLLDNSGSMERSDRREIVQRAFATLAGLLQPADQVTLISFARQPRLLADAVDGGEANQLVESVAQLPSEGGTNLESALQLAFEKAKEHQADNAQNRIVLLTDGAANLGDAEPENLSKMIESMRQSGIAFDAAGIGAEGLNDKILEALTRKGDGRYYLLDRPEDAEDGFARQIAGALRPAAKNVKVQVEFNPNRVGRYKLLGFEKHLLNKEDFRDDTVDAAEMAAAEAGVAVYQVEPKPDGEGDIGSVSVRFLDLESGQMIEKRWPIPYVPNAARPEQGAASLRLATVAAQFAARLKGGPLGDVVDLEELARLTASLPESDQQSERVRQLRDMIQQARQLEGDR